MKAIILAAGRGSRMGELTQDSHKCKSILHGKPLLTWQIEALKGAGINDIAIVRGYLADKLNVHGVSFFENTYWNKSNMVYSLIQADTWLRSGECIVSYSDIVYQSETIVKLRDSSADIAITYDPFWRSLWELRFDNPLDDAETFRVDNNFVLEIGKRAQTLSEIQGQFMGLIKISSPGWKKISDYLDTLPVHIIQSLDMTGLLSRLISTGIAIEAVNISEPWAEVDTESDLQKYNSAQMWNWSMPSNK